MEQFDGPKPEVIRIPIRPVRRDGELVAVEDLDESEVYQIRVGLLKLKDALAVEALIAKKFASVIPALSKGQGIEPGKLGDLVTVDELEDLAKKLGAVCELYNGTSEKTGAERWIPLNEENRARVFGGGRMLAFNRWILGALRVNFADFFDGAGLGSLTKLGALVSSRR